VLSFITSLFYLVPRTFEGQISPRQLMGPDAIGYANAVVGLMEDGSFERLRSIAIASSGHNLEDELFDQEVRAVYKIPDKSLSIKTEFIVGSLRVGFPGIAALVTNQLGLRHLLTAMNVTAALFLVVGAILIYDLLRSHKFKGFISAMVACLSMINISLLVGFHEGGVAQAFMFSATAAFITASLHHGLSQRTRLLLYVAAYLPAISSYVDMLFVYTGVTAICWILARVVNNQESLRRARLSAVGVCLSGVLLAPLSIKLPHFLLRRLADARQGGWNWGSWTELTGVLGIANPYYSSAPDSILAQLVLILLGVVVVHHLKQGEATRSLAGVHIFAGSAVIFGTLFYFYSRILMDHTTYQWFKLVGTFLGPLSIPLIVLAVPRQSVRFQKVNLKTITTLLLVVLLTFSVSLRYVRFYFSESNALPHELVNEISDSDVRAIAREYQAFGHYGWQEIALTPFWSAQYLNRDDGRVRPIAQPDQPVGLIVRESDCPEWECLRDVPEDNKIPIGTQYLIIDLEMSGSEVRLVPQYTQWLRVNRALAKLKAPYVEGDWSDLGPTLRYRG